MRALVVAFLLLAGCKMTMKAPVLIPGQAIGPLKLGMSRAEIAGLMPHPSGQMGPDVGVVGPYDVVFANDKLTSIAFTLTGTTTGLQVGDHTVPASASLDDVARAVPDCGPPEAREGGTVITCSNGRTLIKLVNGQVEVQVLEPIR